MITSQHNTNNNNALYPIVSQTYFVLLLNEYIKSSGLDFDLLDHKQQATDAITYLFTFLMSTRSCQLKTFKTS